jgi:hypothetical protein
VREDGYTADLPSWRDATTASRIGSPSRSRQLRILVRTYGELCVTAGLVLMLFTAYMLWGTGRYVGEQQDRLSKELRPRAVPPSR